MFSSFINFSSSPPNSPNFYRHFHSSLPTTLSNIFPKTKSSPETTKHSTSTYNSLIKSEIDSFRPNQALLLLHHMLAEDAISPDSFTFPTILKACANLLALAEGKQIHSLFIKSHSVSSDDVFVLTSLIHFYATCGLLEDAHLVFDKMPKRNLASWNAMLNGWVRFGDLDSAFKVFDEMPERNVVSWNTLIGGLVRNGRALDALKLFLDFQMLGMKGDESTMASVVAAVAELELLGLGRMAHAHVIRCLVFDGRSLGVCLIDMYAKCGSIGAAYNVFVTVGSKNVGHWTSMIAGFGLHGFAGSALQVFDEMLKSGTIPNDITFIAVLNACSHGGLVSEGLEVFNLMKTFGVEPGVKHYGCLVDLFGRAGLIDEAMELIRVMPVEPSSVIWSSLLAACRNHGCAEVAKLAAGKLIDLDSSKRSSFVLLSNLYADAGRLEDFSIVRRAMEDRALIKVVGFSWIEIDGKFHEFVSGDKKHYKSREIYGLLDGMKSCLRWQAESESFHNISFCSDIAEEMIDIF